MSNDNTDVSIRISLPAHIIAKCKEIQIIDSNGLDKYSIQIIDSKGIAKYVLPCCTPYERSARRTAQRAAWLTAKL